MLPQRLRADAAKLLYLPYATGIASSAQLPNVTEGLLRRGYSELDVRKILGDNWLGLFGRVWAT